MSNPIGKPDDAATEVIKQIQSAFSSRQLQGQLSDSKQLSDTEYSEVMLFKDLRWEDVTVSLIEEASDVVFWFSPEAFCYFLPGVLIAGLQEGRADLLYYDALIGCLDRSPEPDYWDDFFRPRFTLLSVAEIDALSAWVNWLEQFQPETFLWNSYDRVNRTLELLRVHAIASQKDR